MKVMHVFPILHSSRLKLRKIDIDDVPLLVKYADNRKISDRIINIPYPYREPDAVFRIGYVFKGFKERSRFVFAIELKESNEFIGEISLHLEQNNLAQLGYWIGEPFWGRGLAKEAIEAITEFGFDRLEVDKIYALCHEDNVASQKVVMFNNYKELGALGKVIRFEIQKSEFRPKSQ